MRKNVTKTKSNKQQDSETKSMAGNERRLFVFKLTIQIEINSLLNDKIFNVSFLNLKEVQQSIGTLFFGWLRSLFFLGNRSFDLGARWGGRGGRGGGLGRTRGSNLAHLLSAGFQN
jgi:hypothetical protein